MEEMTEITIPLLLKADLDHYAEYTGSETSTVIRKVLEDFLYFKEDQTPEQLEAVSRASFEEFEKLGIKTTHTSILEDLRREGIIDND